MRVYRSCRASYRSTWDDGTQPLGGIAERLGSQPVLTGTEPRQGPGDTRKRNHTMLWKVVSPAGAVTPIHYPNRFG